MSVKRTCGSCTLCCKTMSIPEIAKPAHRWCDHCTIGKGCNIYCERPTPCREFECVWLQDTRGLLDKSMRPDRIKVVLQPTTDGTGLVAHCDPSTPLAWRSPKVLSLLRAFARAGHHANARAGDRYWVITSRTEWPVPDEYLVRGPNERVDVRIPDDIAIAIGVRT